MSVQVTVTFDCEGASDVTTIFAALAQLITVADEAVADAALGPVDQDTKVPSLGAASESEGATPSAPPTPPKKRGRPRKSPPVVEAAPEVVAEADISTPVETPSPAATEVGQADTVVQPDDAIKTGEQLQDYILSLVHQHRIDPPTIKEKVYPKYGVARALDLKPEQVAAVKADIDAHAKPAKPAAPSNDLDL